MDNEHKEKELVAKALNDLKNNTGDTSENVSIVFNKEYKSIERYKGRPGKFSDVYTCKNDMSEITFYENLDDPSDIEDDEFIFMVNGKVWFYNEPDVIEYKYTEEKSEKEDENMDKHNIAYVTALSGKKTSSGLEKIFK